MMAIPEANAWLVNPAEVLVAAALVVVCEALELCEALEVCEPLELWEVPEPQPATAMAASAAAAASLVVKIRAARGAVDRRNIMVNGLRWINGFR